MEISQFWGPRSHPGNQLAAISRGLADTHAARCC